MDAPGRGAMLKALSLSAGGAKVSRLKPSVCGPKKNAIGVYVFRIGHIARGADGGVGLSGSFSREPEESSDAAIDFCGDAAVEVGGGYDAGFSAAGVAGKN